MGAIRCSAFIVREMPSKSGLSIRTKTDSSVYTRSVSTSGQPHLNGTRVAQASCDPEDRVLTGGFVGLGSGTRSIAVKARTHILLTKPSCA